MSLLRFAVLIPVLFLAGCCHDGYRESARFRQEMREVRKEARNHAREVRDQVRSRMREAREEMRRQREDARARYNRDRWDRYYFRYQ